MKREGHALWVEPTPLGRRNGVQRRRLGIYITPELAAAVQFFEIRSLQEQLTTEKERREGAEPWKHLMAFQIEPGVIGECRSCGCTDERACAGGCFWVEPDLCSSCYEGVASQSSQVA